MKKKYDPPKILTDEVEVSTVMTPGPDTTYTTGGGECGSPIITQCGQLCSTGSGKK
jgi:hypothetical protein